MVVVASVDVLGTFARKHEAEAWLTAKWLEYSELRLATQAQWDALRQQSIKLRNFEKRCVEALGRRNNTDSRTTLAAFDTMENAEIRRLVRIVVGNKPAGMQYKAACVQYNDDYTAAFHALTRAKKFHATLKHHTDRFHAKFGSETPLSPLAEYTDDERDDERWSFVDAFFVDREMPGHNRYICPVCEQTSETGYVDARCRNFDCSRYDEPLWTWETFTFWKDHGKLEADGIGRERYEYQLEHGWEARQERLLEAEAELHTLTHLSPLMREIVTHGAKIGTALAHHRRGTQVGVQQYPIWQQVGPRLPKMGDVEGKVAANMRDVDPYENGYMERNSRTARHYSLRPAAMVHRQVSRWEPECPERWDYTDNPHAVAAQGYGSLVVAR